MKCLKREFYKRNDTLLIAQELLGKLLVVPIENGERVSGIIVETEAYLGPEDRAAHSYGNLRTKRTEAMFAKGGIAYVFIVYGIYYQFNVVTGGIDRPHAVLIRAIEPIEGIEKMQERRAGQPLNNLTNGPGKLTIAFGIDKSFNQADLCGGRVWIEERDLESGFEIACGTRIGIEYAGEWANRNYRYWIKGNSFVSK